MSNQIIVECGEGMAAVIEHKKEKDKDQVIKKLKKLLRKTKKVQIIKNTAID